MTRNISVSRFVARLRNLPERKVLGEVHTFINTYFFHFKNRFGIWEFGNLGTLHFTNFLIFEMLTSILHKCLTYNDHLIVY